MSESRGCPIRAKIVRHCSRVATTLSTAESALGEIEPLGPIAEKEIADVVEVFDVTRLLFEALGRRAKGGLAAQAFKAVLRLLNESDVIRAAYDGKPEVSRELTLTGLDQIIVRRQQQADRLWEDWCKRPGEVLPSVNVPCDGLSVACRTRSRELEEIVRARDIITGG